MSDGMLELWLRLLALHLPEPTEGDERHVSLEIRYRWLRASKGFFCGCVPHGMDDICETPAGRATVRAAIDSLIAALKRQGTPLDAGTLNLLGIDGSEFTKPIDRIQLQEIGEAFLDLLDGKITGFSSSTEIMPGSKPYKRGIASG